MKKIMFNDRYGLTRAVLEGRKTMTRRIAQKELVEDENGELRWSGWFKDPHYKEGEVVAVAQSYEAIRNERYKDYCNDIYNPFGTKEPDLESEPGWTNKMFVRADLMPHQIRITSVRVERLQDISDEDCLREGIRKDDPFAFGLCATEDTYGIDGPGYEDRVFTSPRGAFAALIDKVSGKGTWEANPYCFCYTFELVR